MALVQKEPISKEEWQYWKREKVTQALVASLLNRRSEMLEEWAEGRCPTHEETLKQEGRVQAYRDLILYIIQDFEVFDMEKPSDSQSNRT